MKFPSALAVGIAFVLVAGSCGNRPGDAPAGTVASGAPNALNPAAELVPFRAEIALATAQRLPNGVRLNVYVVESDLEAGQRRVIAERSEAGALTFPVRTQVDVPKALLNPERGYEVVATVVDAAGKVVLDATGYRPPIPGVGLSRDATYLVTLGPVVTPAPAGTAFRLPRALVLACDGVKMEVRQVEGRDVVLTSSAGEIRLPPAVAASGGRFSDGSTEFWITQRLEAFVIIPGTAPLQCTVK